MTTDERIHAVVAWMHSEFGARINVGAMAHRVGVSGSRFTHAFRSTTGTTPARYLKRVRLSVAAALLSYTPLRIKEITFKVGFVNHGHFIREFKSAYGLTPSEFRRRTT
jgi:transcriptional regulator GlxA family with amidase domain